MKKLHELKKVDGVTVHSTFEKDYPAHGVVNIDPDDQERVADLLEECGYRVVSFEELRDYEDGEHFTRVEVVEEEREATL